MKKVTLPSFNLGPIFHNKNVYVCFTEDDYNNWNGWGPNGPNNPFLANDLLGCHTRFGDDEALICLDPTRHKTFIDVMDTAAHEASHFADGMMDMLNDTKPSSEINAIIVGQVAGFVMDEYFKKRKTISNKEPK